MAEKGCMPNSTAYNIVVDALLKSGNTQAALDLSGLTNGCTPDLITYNTVISNVTKAGKIEEALDLLHVMVSKGLCPDTTTLQSLAYGLSREDGTHKAIGECRIWAYHPTL
jgi:pentatricopeptide repeat protein